MNGTQYQRVLRPLDFRRQSSQHRITQRVPLRRNRWQILDHPSPNVQKHARSSSSCWHLPRGPPLPSCLLCAVGEVMVVVVSSSSLTLTLVKRFQMWAIYMCGSFGLLFGLRYMTNKEESPSTVVLGHVSPRVVINISHSLQNRRHACIDLNPTEAVDSGEAEAPSYLYQARTRLQRASSVVDSCFLDSYRFIQTLRSTNRHGLTDVEIIHSHAYVRSSFYKEVES